MIIKVYMWAFNEGKIREVEIPDYTPEDKVLEEVFYWGQNEHQPKEISSVSVGDVIEYRGRFWEVMPFGFEERE